MADRKKMLERVKALIARTTSDSEEEARSSALIACRLIREHEFEVINPDEFIKRPPPRQPPNPFDGVPYDPFRTSVSLEDLFDAMGRAVNVPSGSAHRERENQRKQAEAASARARSAERTRVDINKKAEEERAKQARYKKERAAQEKKNREELERKNRTEERLKREKATQNRPCPTNQPLGPAYRKEDIWWFAFPADVNGKCTGCGREFIEGDAVVWAAGFGVFRSECMSDKKNEFLFVAVQPSQVTDGTPPASAPPKNTDLHAPLFCKRHVWSKRYDESGYSGLCKKCGHRYHKGDPITWVIGIGSFHPECWALLGPTDKLPVQEPAKALEAVNERFRNSEWEELKKEFA